MVEKVMGDPNMRENIPPSLSSQNTINTSPIQAAVVDANHLQKRGLRKIQSIPAKPKQPPKKSVLFMQGKHNLFKQTDPLA